VKSAPLVTPSISQGKLKRPFLGSRFKKKLPKEISKDPATEKNFPAYFGSRKVSAGRGVHIGSLFLPPCDSRIRSPVFL